MMRNVKLPEEDRFTATEVELFHEVMSTLDGFGVKPWKLVLLLERLTDIEPPEDEPTN